MALIEGSVYVPPFAQHDLFADDTYREREAREAFADERPNPVEERFLTLWPFYQSSPHVFRSYLADMCPEAMEEFDDEVFNAGIVTQRRQYEIWFFVWSKYRAVMGDVMQARLVAKQRAAEVEIEQWIRESQ